MTLHPSLVSFLERGVSIHMGTRNAACEPNGTRVVAVVVEPDHEHLTAYIPSVESALVVADLTSNGKAALAFARPIDDRACQIKGECVGIRDAEPSELGRVQEQWQGLVEQLQLVGIPAEATLGWATWPCVAVRLRVTAAFEQTPGPGAGSRIETTEAG
ncbi:MAG: pyridoxamine 5'-phosphate oxidase family protein [Acidobacteria bacterium]|nr:pyridoxamine 5'-phosphate oxidase family protein [Acidobacteriota bacterium]